MLSVGTFTGLTSIILILMHCAYISIRLRESTIGALFFIILPGAKYTRAKFLGVRFSYSQFGKEPNRSTPYQKVILLLFV